MIAATRLRRDRLIVLFDAIAIRPGRDLTPGRTRRSDAAAPMTLEPLTWLREWRPRRREFGARMSRRWLRQFQVAHAKREPGT